MPRVFVYDKYHEDLRNMVTASRLAELAPQVVVPYEIPWYKTPNVTDDSYDLNPFWLTFDTKRYLTAGPSPNPTRMVTSANDKSPFNMTKQYKSSRYYSVYNKGFTWDDTDAGFNNMITIDPNVVITVGNSTFITSLITLTPSNLDTGTAFTLGTDYYVYICDPTNGDNTIDQDEVYVISANSTYPTGWTEDNSRKIGGFHYGKVRKINELLQPVGTDTLPENVGRPFYPLEVNLKPYGTNWITNVHDGIVPNSVWTLLHRPISNPEGMVYLGNNLWGDIYLATIDQATGIAQSRYNVLPTTGANKFMWYDFIEYANFNNKRLPTYDEYCRAAMGSPPGLNNNTNAYCASGNKVTTGKTGQVVNAISSFNVRDLVGLAWKHLSNTVIISNTIPTPDINKTFNMKSQTTYGAKEQDVGNIGGEGGALRVLHAGGGYNNQIYCGSRALALDRNTATLATDAGAWLVSESMYPIRDGGI